MWSSRGSREPRGQVAVGLVLSLCGCVLLWLIVSGVRSGSGALVSGAVRSQRLQTELTASATAHAAWMGRLPCPASTVGGTEDCALDAGWWPQASLQGSSTGTGVFKVVQVALRYRVDARVARALLGVAQRSADADPGWTLCQVLSAAPSESAEAFRVEAVQSPASEAADLVVSHSQLSAQLGCPVALSGLAAIRTVVPRGEMAAAKANKSMRDIDLWRFMRVANVVSAAASLKADVGNVINESDVSLQSAVYQIACLGLCPQYVAAMSTETVALGLSEVSMIMASASLAAHINLLVSSEATRAALANVPLWPLERRATLMDNARRLGSL